MKGKGLMHGVAACPLWRLSRRSSTAVRAKTSGRRVCAGVWSTEIFSRFWMMTLAAPTFVAGGGRRGLTSVHSVVWVWKHITQLSHSVGQSMDIAPIGINGCFQLLCKMLVPNRSVLSACCNSSAGKPTA